MPDRVFLRIITEASLLLEALLQVRLRRKVLEIERTVPQDPSEVRKEASELQTSLVLVSNFDFIREKKDHREVL